MKLPILLALLALSGGVFAAWRMQRTEQPTCWSPETFDRVYQYVTWKDQTSKIGKVLVDRYEVRMEDGALAFSRDGYTLFRYTRTEGLQLLAVKQPERLRRRAEKAFCELLERARLRGM